MLEMVKFWTPSLSSFRAPKLTFALRPTLISERSRPIADYHRYRSSLSQPDTDSFARRDEASRQERLEMEVRRLTLRRWRSRSFSRCSRCCQSYRGQVIVLSRLGEERTEEGVQTQKEERKKKHGLLFFIVLIHYRSSVRASDLLCTLSSIMQCLSTTVYLILGLSRVPSLRPFPLIR